MRMSASGLESTMAVAIDQILRLAPSSRPPIEPVVSSTNATSTAGFAQADDRPAGSDRAVSARAKAVGAMRGAVGPPPVGDGAGDRAWHRAAATIAGVFLHRRTAAALGPARRPGGAEREGRNLDRRDQIIGGRFARRPEMAG